MIAYSRLYIVFIITVIQLGVFPVLGAQVVEVVDISRDFGLSQSVVNALEFDDNGYLWIATENGLNRFNGYEMKVFKSNQKNNLIDDHVKDLYYCNDTLWFATYTNSLCAYVLSQDKFLDFSNKFDFKTHPYIKYSYLVYPLNSELLFVGTSRGGILYNRGNSTFQIIQISEVSENDYVTSIVKLVENKYLIGTNFSGVFLFDLKTKKISSYKELGILNNVRVKAFYQLSPSELLIGTSNGVYYHKLDSNKVRLISNTINPKDPIISISKWDDEKLLIGGMKDAYFLYNDLHWSDVQFVNQSGKKLETFISGIKKDKSGGFWIGTEGGEGIFYYHPGQKKFSPYRIDSGSDKMDFISIFGMLRVKDYVWLAMEQGISRYKVGTNNYKNYNTHGLMNSLVRDRDDNLWAGGIGRGVLKYNGEKDQFETVNLPIKDKDVVQLTVVDKDTLWIHTRSAGIYAMNTNDYGVRQIMIKGKVITRSRASFISSSNDLWIGSEEGLYRIRHSGKTDFYSFYNNRIFSVTEDPDQNIWVGTAKGLNRIDHKTDSIKLYTEEVGLPNDFIYGVESDRNGNIWVSTNQGLSRLDKQTDTFNNYTEVDGLQNNEFNSKAYFKDSLGYIYFGGMNGFNMFDPDSIYNNDFIGKTIIENVKLFGNSMPVNAPYCDTLIFSYKQNVLTFEYAGLNYLWAQKNRFQYKMEGFDTDWRPVTSERNTTYTNLNPGNYVFKVKSCNNDKVWGEPTSLVIIIEAPWYKKKWFYVSALGILLLIGFGIFSLVNYRQRMVNRHLSGMVKERTRELTTVNENLNSSLEVTRQQKENISFLMRELNHRVKNHLQLISSLIDMQDANITDGFAKEKLRNLQSKIFTISRVYNFLKYNEGKSELLIDDFLQSIAEELVGFSDQQIVLKQNYIAVPFRVSKLTYLGLIINELISNTIKYAFDEHQKNCEISIALTEENDMLQLVYCDNGKGFNPELIDAKNHIGLDLIKTLVRGLRGSCKTYSDNGVIFYLYFPKSII